MLAKEIAADCLRETGARGISRHSEEIALIGLVHSSLAMTSKNKFRKQMRATFLKGHPNVGSFFVVFILPLLISIISNWIVRWIMNRRDLPRIQGQAYDALIELSPSTTDTLTSTSTPPKNPTEPGGW